MQAEDGLELNFAKGKYTAPIWNPEIGWSFDSMKKKDLTLWNLKGSNTMAKITMTVDNQYVEVFVAFLKTIHYIKVEKVTNGAANRKSKKESGDSTDKLVP